MAYAAVAIFLAIFVAIVAPVWLAIRALCRPTLGDLENVQIAAPTAGSPPIRASRPALWPECP